MLQRFVISVIPLHSRTTLYLSYISSNTTALRRQCIRESSECAHQRIVKIVSPHNAPEALPVNQCFIFSCKVNWGFFLTSISCFLGVGVISRESLPSDIRYASINTIPTLQRPCYLSRENPSSASNSNQEVKFYILQKDLLNTSILWWRHRNSGLENIETILCSCHYDTRDLGVEMNLLHVALSLVDEQ